MNKLLSAGFSRLWKNIFFWGEILLMSGFIVFILLTNYTDGVKYNICYLTDNFWPGCFMVIGIFTALFAAMFLGTEYSDGTIRNKLIAGHSRSSLYLSSLIVCFVSSLFICLGGLLAAFLLGIPLFGPLTKPLSHTMALLGIGIMTVAAFSALFTMIAMLASNKTVSAVLCILGFFLLLTAAIYVGMRLDEPEICEGFYEMTANGDILPGKPYPNPHYLRGTARAVFVFFQDFLPTGQGFQLAGQNMQPRIILPLYSLLLTITTTLIGIFVFQRKDLK